MDAIALGIEHHRADVAAALRKGEYPDALAVSAEVHRVLDARSMVR